MSKRFQIEDIEVQDSSGIVFRATDTVTGGPVAVRRFFPFGSASVGLNAGDQVSYDLLLGRFAELRHPALRSIISGGCDAVDGVPYIVAEWIEGDLLDILLEHRPLSEPEATALISLALDACEALTGLLGEEGVWIETAANTIAIRPVGAQRPFTFWISPLRWLSRTIDPRGLEPLVGLTESIMGVAGHAFERLPESGMGGWLRWLRGAAPTASLREAREMLARFTGTEPPPVAAGKAVGEVAAVVPPAKQKIKSRSKAPARILALTVLLALGVGGWMMVRRNAALIAEASAPLPSSVRILTSDALPPVAPQSKPDLAEKMEQPVSAASAANPGGISTGKIAGEAAVAPEPAKAAVAPAAKKAAAEKMKRKLQEIKKRGFYLPEEGDLLLAAKGKVITLEGTVAYVRKGPGGRTGAFFIEFSEPYLENQPRGRVEKKNLTGNFNEEFIRKYRGKKVRIQGEVSVQGKCPEIEMTDSDSIKVIIP